MKGLKNLNLSLKSAKMNIESCWILNSESAKVVSTMPTSKVLVSPNNKIICTHGVTSIDFHDENDKKSLDFDLMNGEKINCFEVVSKSPWILCFGTNIGNLYFFDENKVLLKLSPYNGNIQNMKLCSFSDSQLTKKSNVLLIRYLENVFATIDIDSLLCKIKEEKNDDLKVNIQKWQTNHNDIVDSIIVNSNLSSFMFSGLHKFPAIFNVGSNPFISVYSISEPQETGATEKVKQVASRFFKKAASWVTGSETKEEEPPIPKAVFEWELNDDGRTGRKVLANPTGRWLGITDNQGRVIIVDSVFGHIARVLKGMRDSQIAWYDNYLLVFIPSREMIVSYLIPCGKIFDAVRVDKNGKLIQTYGSDNKFGVVFIDSKGNVGALKVNYSDKSISDNEVYSVTDYHFEFPTTLTNDSDPVIQELHNEIVKDPINKEAIIMLAKKIESFSLAASFIRTLLLYPCITDELVLKVINYFKENIKTEPFKEDSKSFFLNNNSSIKRTNDEFEYKTYIELTTRWETYSKFQAIEVQYDNELPFDIKPDSNEISPPPSITLQAFLTNPINEPLFFFSFIRSDQITVMNILESYFYSKSTREDFILQFLIWVLSCSPAQLVLSNTSIQDFFSIKEVKEQSIQLLKQIVSPQNTFNQAYLQYYLNKQ